MAFLIIETSTERGIFIWAENEKVILAEELPTGFNQSRFLMPQLIAAIEKHGLKSSALEGIGLGIGPGSYTGMRIGAAVAQTLAYSWNLPMVGVSSLCGFVPREKLGPFAVVVDAKMSGAHIMQGIKEKDRVYFTDAPQTCPLAKLKDLVKPDTWLVTPVSSALKTKLAAIDPENEWEWEERHPCPEILAQKIAEAFANGETKIAGELKLIYPHPHAG